MITIDNILSKVSEEELIRYLVPEFNSNIRQKNYKSIFSDKDNRPSMSIYQKNGHWKFKSHNTGHGGNVFQLWADYYQIDTRINFKDVLKKINEEFNLRLEDNPPLAIEYTSFSALFLAYWAQFGIKQDILKHYDVRQVDKISFKSKNGKQLNFNYTAYGQIVACYHVNGRIKTYVPQIPQGFNNSSFKGQKKVFGYKNQKRSDVFGLTQLPSKLAYILFTAGEKDCLAANVRGFPSISLQSENQFPEVSLLKSLESRTKALVCCYDNDKAGRKAAQKLEDKFGLVSIHLPEGIKDIADYFLQYTAEDFRPLLEAAVEKSLHINRDKLTNHVSNTDLFKKVSVKGATVFHCAKSYLFERYQFRFNTVKKQYEFSPIDLNNYQEINEDELHVEVNEAGIKISLTNLVSLLKSGICEDYNPIQAYFKQLPNWQEGDIDYIDKLAGYVKTELPHVWPLAFKKWLVRTVRGVMEPKYFNKQVLILVSTHQNSGKSTFCRNLCPPFLDGYVAENVNPGSKDSLIALASNFIINLDELHQFSRADINVLKSWVSQSEISVRLPYAKKSTNMPRYASFVGSTNMSEFLYDETGSVRWLCFKVLSIDFNYNNTYTNHREIAIDNVWAQAYELYKSGFQAEMDSQEIADNEGPNKSFIHLPPEFEILPNYFEPSNDQEGNFMTSTDIMNYIQPYTNYKLYPMRIGRALSYYGFEKVMHNKLKRYGYWVANLK